MNMPQVQFLRASVGKWIGGGSVVPDQASARAFAGAINDDTTELLDGTSVTPMFGIVPIYGPLFEAVDSVTPEHLRGTIVHGAHEILFHGPIVAGVPISARARVTGLHGSRAGTVVSVQIIVTTTEGHLSSEQWATAIVRGATPSADLGERTTVGKVNAGANAADAELNRVVSSVLPNQTHLYAAASGDNNAVHVDDEAARQAGFAGVILHGLCTLGIVASSITRTSAVGDQQRLRRVAARFAGPAYPGVDLVTDIRAMHPADCYNFETCDAGGRKVLSNGLIEIR
jgi:acyl dehydratase